MPVGVSPEQLDAVDQLLPRSASLAALLLGVNHRHLYSEATSADRFRAVFFDYTGQRTIVAEAGAEEPANEAIFDGGSDHGKKRFGLEER
ncbi:MAG: hypothetical protein ABI016_04325 [Chthoniobacterales bacterium]